MSEQPLKGFFRDDKTEEEEITGVPNGFRDLVRQVAKNELPFDFLLPNWAYIRRINGYADWETDASDTD